MILRLYAFLLLAVLAPSALEAAGDQSRGGVILSRADRDYPGLYVNSSMAAGNNTDDRPGITDPGNIASSILMPDAMHRTYGSHYLNFLYKQILCMCSLYWLLAGYRHYRPGRISDNKRNATAEF